MNKLFLMLAPLALLSVAACQDPQQQQQQQQDGQQAPGYAPQGDDHMVRDGLIGGAIGYFAGHAMGSRQNYRQPVVVQHVVVQHVYHQPYYAPRPSYYQRPAYSAPSYRSYSSSSYRSSYRHH